MDSEQLKAEHIISLAKQTAEQVASKAVEVAYEVTKKATETAEKVLLFSQSMDYMAKDICEIKLKLDSKFVTKEEFNLVRALVFGLVSLILVAFVAALISLVYIKR